MEDELFFVGIRDPVELRKELLTSSKNLIDSLKRYEAYKDIKEEKLQKITELKRTFDEIMILNKKLRNHMPKTPLRAPITRTEKTTKAQKAGPTKFGKTKIDVLEQELAKIEERLGGLE